jgi:hypothetical protein
MKGVTIREIRDEDFVEVSDWFAARKWQIPPSAKTLPETGYVAQKDDGTLLAVAWLYITNSDVGIVDWICSNPSAGMAQGLRSIVKLIDFIEAVSAGRCNVFMHFTPNTKFAKFLGKKCRFKTTETGVNLCFRRRSMEAPAHG